MTCAVVVWVLLGTPAGYVASRLYKCKQSRIIHQSKAGGFLLADVMLISPVL